MDRRFPIRFALCALSLVTLLAGSLYAVQSHFGTGAAVAGYLALTVGTSAFLTSPQFGMKPLLKMPDFTGNFTAGKKCSSLFPSGAAYHLSQLRFFTAGVAMTVAQMKSMVSKITMKMLGKPVREWTPTSLDISNATNGAQYAAADGHLNDFYSEYWRRTLEGEERQGLGTAGSDGITYEVEWSGTAVDPSVDAYALVDELDRPFNAYPFRHIRNYAGMAAVNGVSQWPGAGILRAPNLWYDRLHFLSNLITNVEVRINRVPKWDNVPRTVAVELLRLRGCAMQANTYSLAFSGNSQQLTDQLASFFIDGGGNKVPVNDLTIKWTGSGAGNFDICVEQYEYIS